MFSNNQLNEWKRNISTTVSLKCFKVQIPKFAIPPLLFFANLQMDKGKQAAFQNKAFGT